MVELLRRWLRLVDRGTGQELAHRGDERLQVASLIALAVAVAPMGMLALADRWLPLGGWVGFVLFVIAAAWFVLTVLLLFYVRIASVVRRLRRHYRRGAGR